MRSRALYILIAITVAAATAVTWLVSTHPGVEAPPSHVLRDYVAKPDASVALRPYGRTTIGTTELIELRLQSQTWHDVLWKHRLFVIKPANLVTERQALLVIGGGRWHAEYDQTPSSYVPPKDSALFLGMAESLGSVVVVIDDVPYQPLFGMSEDMLIAYTLDQYLKTGESDWPLLLPMVKSAVKAMDAGQKTAREEWGLELEHYTVTGGSKRGWTSWLAAAVDDRVNAVAPIVIDALNMAEHFPYQTHVWGSPSVEIRPYTDRKLDVILSSDEGRELREIIDPYAYRAVLQQPKLIINASNDEYFPIDSINLYWGGLVGEKHALYLPNDTHDAKDVIRVIESLNALNRHAAGLIDLPDLEWEYRDDGDALRLCLRAEPAPEHVRVWLAGSDDRDFRDEVWRAQPLEARDGTYENDVPRSTDNYAAIFAEAEFALGDGTYSLTTTPAVLAPPGGITGAPMQSTGQVCGDSS